MQFAIIRNGIVVSLPEMTTGFENIKLASGEIFSIKIDSTPNIPEHKLKFVLKIMGGSEFRKLKLGSAVAQLRIGRLNEKELPPYICSSFIQSVVVSDAIALKNFIYREFLGEQTVELFLDGGIEKLLQTTMETIQSTAIQAIRLVDGILTTLVELDGQKR